MEQAPIDFDFERCFVDGGSGSVELGVTSLDELAARHGPAIDARDGQGGWPAQYLAYQADPASESLRFFSTDRSGRIDQVHLDLFGRQVLESRSRNPAWPAYELSCGPFRPRLNGRDVERWAALVDAIASGALEPTRLVSLTADARSDLRTLNVESRLRGRWLHLAYEPQLIEDRSNHACRVTFEYCIARVRLFAE